jgi:hypothetical protein
LSIDRDNGAGTNGEPAIIVGKLQPAKRQQRAAAELEHPIATGAVIKLRLRLSLCEPAKQQWQQRQSV